MFNVIEQFLLGDNWTYEVVGDDGSIAKFGASGKNGSFECFTLYDADSHRVECYVQAPVKVPEPMRGIVGELLLRANWPLAVGAFQIDFSDGEVRYKSTIPLGEDGEVTTSMIQEIVMLSLITMDKYFPAIMSVAYAGTDPAEALAKAREEETSDE